MNAVRLTGRALRWVWLAMSLVGWAAMGAAPAAQPPSSIPCTICSTDLFGRGLSFTPPEPDTQPPTITIDAPTGGTVSGAAVTIATTATDNIAVARVRFLVDQTEIGERTFPPFSHAWDTTTV